MARQAPLSITFIEKRPLSAARALASIDPGDAAALLETVPSRFAAMALDHMDAGPASSVVGRMNAVSAAAILRELEYPDAAAVLRHLSPGIQAQILEQLPKKIRRDFEISLSYPDDTVGAHMATTIMTAGPDATAADALDVMRRSPAESGEVIFIVNQAKRLTGTVRAASLLRQAGTVKLGDIMEEVPASVSARARLAIVAELEAWDAFAHLPVTNREKQVIGVLSRKAVRAALEYSGSKAASRQPSIVAAMTEAFFTGTYGLAQLLADIQPARGNPPAEGGR